MNHTFVSCTYFCEYSKSVEHIRSTKGDNSVKALVVKCDHELCSENTLPESISIIK